MVSTLYDAHSYKCIGSTGKNDTRDFYVRTDSWRLAGQYLQGGKARGKCFYVRNDSWRLAGQYLQGEKARG